MSTLLTVVALLGATIGLWLGARWLVAAATSIASAAGISPLVIGLTVVAFGTSAPELAVSTVAAFEGTGDVAVGNVVGSNVFNLGVILGIVAILAPFRVTETMIRRDALALAAATVIAAGVLANRVVSRPEGALLLVLLIAYLGAIGIEIRRTTADETTTAPATNGVPSQTRDNTADAAESVRGASSDSNTDTTNDDLRDRQRPTSRRGSPRAADREHPQSLHRSYESARFLVGLLLVIGSSRLLVDSATTIALSIGLSTWLIGVTVVAAGTSLPELVTAVVAARRGDVSIAAGNVIGSNVFNLFGVLGLAATIRPLAVDPAVLPGLAWLLVVTLVATVLLATGRRVNRLEGVLLLAVGVGYWVGSAII
ncbi:calcium/sodium antiporter [Natrialba asiatica]|uniref:CaCA family Na+/Ca+ antiporter n=1 Tax=Natrialba asiatica (strain ATCC 700177 / DSM 12278 / JCM 9576 / FERM P-10747 / NBRC 102637 / 172P1) TaxID=29540 RepID=M0AVI2_NATA1|nr:calcium/sodium antiporter [Natrialba asiatica]ELZ01963.1 CaCA family Na+/Ca+ antiporter [Natrialba asiatica DSM 12278]